MKHIIYIFLFSQIILYSCGSKTIAQQGGKGAPPQMSEYYFTEGMKNYITGNLVEAEVWFQKSLAPKHEQPGVNYMLAKIYFTQGKPTDAISCITKAIKLAPKNKYYYLLAAGIYEKQQNLDEAIKIYKKLIAEIPDTDEFYYDLAAVLIYKKEYEEALKVYNKIESIYGESIEVSQQKQQLYLKMNKLDLALKVGESLMETYPEEIEFKLIQAEILYSNNKQKEAVALMESIISHYPTDPQARLLLFEFYIASENSQKALEQLEIIFSNPEIDLNSKLGTLENLKRLSPDSDVKIHLIKIAGLLITHHSGEAKAYAAAGDIYYMTDKKEEAYNSFLLGKQKDPSDFNLWNKLILLDSELSKTDSMIVHSEQALETFPNQALLWLYNGNGYLLKKNPKKAIEALEEGRKLSSNNAELQNEFDIRLGDSYHEVKEFGKSDDAFNRVLKIDGNNEHVLNNYSYFLSIRKEKLDIAKEMSEKLIKQHPDNSTYLDTYAWVLYMLKDYNEAKKYLEIASAKSNNGTILEHYGDSLFMTGEKEKAIEQWKKAKALGETSDLIDKKIKDKTLYE